jgi:hypothetical protein
MSEEKNVLSLFKNGLKSLKFWSHNIPFEFPMFSNYQCFSLEVFECFSSIGNVEVSLLIKLLLPSSLARYMYYFVSMCVKGLGVRVLELTSITHNIAEILPS